jgi:hypothetical protein
MFRLVYQPSAAWAAVDLLALSVYLGLPLTAFDITNQPIPYVIIPLTPAGMFAGFLYLFARGPVTWEVDDFVVRESRGGRTVQIALADVGRVTVTESAGTGRPALGIAAREGRTGLTLAAGQGLSAEDVRAFYEALAFHLAPHPAVVTNPYGWQGRRPSAPERRAAGMRIDATDVRGGLAVHLLLSSLPLLAGSPWAFPTYPPSASS